MPTQPQPPATVYGAWTPFGTDSSAGSGGSSWSSSGSPNAGDASDPLVRPSIVAAGVSASADTNLNIPSSGKSKSRPHAVARESSSRSIKSSSSRGMSPRRLKLNKSSLAQRSHRMVCHDCGTEDTPQWRLGLNGPGTLCNVCGLLFAKRTQRLKSKFH